MKKLVAFFIVLYFVVMGTMFVWGFIDKQNKQKQIDSANSNNQTSMVDSSSNTMQTTPRQQDTAQTTMPKEITLREVQKHQTKSDCWIIINSKVYDVTDYLELHPGGAEKIISKCGSDATSAFNTKGGMGVGHSGKADRDMAKHLVGTLAQ